MSCGLWGVFSRKLGTLNSEEIVENPTSSIEVPRGKIIASLSYLVEAGRQTLGLWRAELRFAGSLTHRASPMQIQPPFQGLVHFLEHNSIAFDSKILKTLLQISEYRFSLSIKWAPSCLMDYLAVLGDGWKRSINCAGECEHHCVFSRKSGL